MPAHCEANPSLANVQVKNDPDQNYGSTPVAIIDNLSSLKTDNSCSAAEQCCTTGDCRLCTLGIQSHSYVAAIEIETETVQYTEQGSLATNEPFILKEPKIEEFLPVSEFDKVVMEQKTRQREKKIELDRAAAVLPENIITSKRKRKCADSMKAHFLSLVKEEEESEETEKGNRCKRKKKKNSEGARKVGRRQRMSPEKLTLLRERERIKKAERMQQMSAEQLAALREKNRIMAAERRRRLPPEEREKLKEKHRIWTAEKRRRLPPEERERLKEKDRIWAAEKRRSLPLEEREKLKEKERLWAAEKRQRLSEEKRTLEREKNRVRTAERRREMQQELREMKDIEQYAIDEQDAFVKELKRVETINEEKRMEWRLKRQMMSEEQKAEYRDKARIRKERRKQLLEQEEPGKYIEIIKKRRLENQERGMRIMETIEYVCNIMSD